MYCPNCGTKNENEYKFCPNCGFEIGKIQLKNDNELNQIKVSSKIVDFPSEVWNKLVITKEDIDLFTEHVGHADIMFDDEEVVYTKEIIDIQNKFVLTRADIDLLISSINSDYNYIIDDEDEELSHYFFGQIKNGQRHGFVCYIRGTKDDEVTEMKYVINYSGYWVNDQREGFGIEISPYHLTPQYIGEYKNGSFNGHGTEVYSRKERYTGEWENGSYNGFGIKYLEDGEKQYEGQFKNGKLNGKGYSYFYEPSGVIRLQGLFENGKLLNGIEFNSDGQKKYEGTFKDGNILNGIEYIDGIKKYEGEFKYDEETYEEGIWHGKGKCFYDDGGVYEGDFVNNEITGKGKLFFEDGTIFEGDFIKGELHGFGKKSHAEGYVFEGNFENGIQNGKGKCTTPNGWFYEGDFVDGSINGKGKRTYNNGIVYEGDFVESKLNGKGKISHPDGAIIEGDFVDDNLNGNGKKMFPNGTIQEGYFIDDKLNGKGKLTNIEGSYEGNWELNLPIGDFIFTNKEGNKINGHFKIEDNQSLTFISNTSTASPIPPKDGAGLR